MRDILEIVKFIYKFITGLGAFALGILTLLLIAVIWSATQFEAVRPKVSDGSVMILAPTGRLVEQTRTRDPFEVLFDNYDRRPSETSIHNLLAAIKRATTDDRIHAIAVQTDGFWGAGQSHLHDIADALKTFKSADKKVYAVSTNYSQADYLIASEADEIFLNPAGSVLLTGLGQYGTYIGGLLEKIDASVNVFRVGTYKAAVEPLLRNDMSPEAREASLSLLDTLWEQYASRVTKARTIARDKFDQMMNDTPAAFRSAGGDFAVFAEQQGLIDTLSPRQDWRNYLAGIYGKSDGGKSFKQIHWRTYLSATSKGKQSGKKIAVITAQGEIIGGEGPQNVAAAETLITYIRAARNDTSVGAIVLRVNSPGGSSIASELIRQELSEAQKQGIPVIASFGPVAASGGYWIAASADEIWAAPSTITGSIGIFAVLPTFEKTFAKFGIYSDGVGTSPLSDGISPARALTEPIKDIFQQSIERGYQDFISLVANSRGMSTEEVDKIAQGRVWAGSTAHSLGLVDHLGNFDQAVQSAAKKAGIENYRVVHYRKQSSKFDQLLIDFMQSSFVRSFTGHSLSQNVLPTTMVVNELKELEKQAAKLLRFNDPLGHYALCLVCAVR